MVRHAVSELLLRTPLMVEQVPVKSRRDEALDVAVAVTAGRPDDDEDIKFFGEHFPGEVE